MKIRIVSNSKHILSVKIIILAAVIGLINSFFYGNLMIMMALCALEVFILLYCLIKNDDLHYLCFYLIFLCFSMESETFVGTSIFYGFKNFRIAGLNLSMWMLCPLILKSILGLQSSKKYMGSVHKAILNRISFFTILGSLMGILTYLSNDNGFMMAKGSFSILFSTYYAYIVPFLEVLVASYVVVQNADRIQIIKQYLFSCIIALSIVFIACLVLGNYGNRGGLMSLQVSDIYFLLVSSLALLVYPQFDKKTRSCLLFSSLIILILSLAYNTSGKIVITTILTPIAMIVIMAKQGSSTKTLVMVGVAVFGLIIASQIIFPYLMSSSRLFAIKFEQASDMFSFGSGDWLRNMASSPKMRITEFMNIAAEYVLKPWYAIFGKGFVGTIKDNLHLFDELSTFAFSEWELHLRAYFSMHESVNCFFLVGGISGLYIIFSISLKIFSNIHKSPWLVFGFMWILLFYNYHMSIAIYGVIALAVGLQDVALWKENITANGMRGIDYVNTGN